MVGEEGINGPTTTFSFGSFQIAFGRGVMWKNGTITEDKTAQATTYK
jgi:hypothetical protein